ncbi:hypothetical protein SPACI_008200 [Sporomusa acidovorans DSM 3132]|uniref:Trans-aconitate 2-methyltransferase n=2 Tax=Sporomusa TaxID=2375 RepID=A0ABZ3IXT5_SPOA4
MNTNKTDIFQRLKRVTFEDFKQMALDNTLSTHEKIGFPDSYRQDYTKAIVEDISRKIPAFAERQKTILDIGCGCDELAINIIKYCEKQQHRLILIDSNEMLSLLPNYEFVEKYPCKFPENDTFISRYRDSVDGILVYSVLQHIILEANLFSFIDKALELLKAGGTLLLGDIPNISKRKRFFSSPSGIKTHQNFTGTDEIPQINFLNIEHEKIDDAIVFAILQRYRSFGFETYLVPQHTTLPMATRREDIVIVKSQ